MALTAVLRKFRVPAVALSLTVFLGLFILTTSDAGAYHDPLPTKNFEQDLVDGDPDDPVPFHGRHVVLQESEEPGGMALFLRALGEIVVFLDL
ncbi:MAG: hypothetical protein ABIH26_00400 [Candidatus Eisenbacteria bacterium]